MNNQVVLMNIVTNKASYGITTGSAATAAALAALLSILHDTKPTSVQINAPFGDLEIEILNAEKIDETTGKALVVKKPYPDPDVTINLEIGAEVHLRDNDGIIIQGGQGIGKITKPGLQVPVGESAINPVPRKMIHDNLQKILPKGKGALVTIYIPLGEEIASRTMNPRLGIEGGISILGTTGVARSMSLESYKTALSCQIDVGLAQGYEELVFVPGNIGEKLALKSLNVEKDQVVQMSNYVGYMLEQAHENGVKKIILFGHAGKLVKVAGGIFNTKHSVADARSEIIAAHAALAGASQELIEKIFHSKTTEDMIDLMETEGISEKVFQNIAHAIKEKCQDRYPLKMEVIIVRMDGTVLNPPNH
jgi:cobalt-precorrin-5B (C1)-methyltransferase